MASRMRRASSRRSATTATSRHRPKRQRKSVRRKISDRSVVAVTSCLSKPYGSLPCLCEHDPQRTMSDTPAALLSNSSNAFWNRSQAKSKSKEAQRNNSTASDYPPRNALGSRKFQTLRKAIAQRLRGNSKKKKPTINARSVLYHRSKPRRMSSTGILNTPNVDRHRSSSESPSLFSHESVDRDEDDGLAPSTSLFKRDYQNINATHNLSRSVQQVSQTVVHPSTATSKRDASRAAHTQAKHSKVARPAAETKSSQHQKSAQQKMTSTKKKVISKAKHQNSSTSLSVHKSTSHIKRLAHARGPFVDPTVFQLQPRMQNPTEIRQDNVHASHLCCKPISAVKNLSTGDQKKLIEHDHLTLISLLPLYLGSQGDFQHRIREKTRISETAAVELERLLNEWGSARLFVGANSHYKTLTQTI